MPYAKYLKVVQNEFDLAIRLLEQMKKEFMNPNNNPNPASIRDELKKIQSDTKELKLLM